MFLPTTLEEAKNIGWNHFDIILVTGDTYIDSPYIGISVIGFVTNWLSLETIDFIWVPILDIALPNIVFLDDSFFVTIPPPFINPLTSIALESGVIITTGAPLVSILIWGLIIEVGWSNFGIEGVGTPMPPIPAALAIFVGVAAIGLYGLGVGVDT